METKKEASVSAFDLPVDPIAIFQQYVFQAGSVAAMAVTDTLNGVTPRQIVFATAGGLLAIKKDIWLNPRRPVSPPSPFPIPARLKVTSEEPIPPYNVTLPIIPTDMLSHRHSLEKIEKILTLPTHLESTSIAISFGKDIFCVPVYLGNAPYDVLPPFFNYGLLYTAGAVILAGGLVTSFLAKRRALYDKWK